MRRYQFKKKYGITIEDYEALRDAQGCACAICGRTEPVGRISQFGEDFWLHVDHDHDSGRVRGLLCTNCNRGLGTFQDDPEVLRRAIAYIDYVP
jgi:hypothetical protein